MKSKTFLELFATTLALCLIWEGYLCIRTYIRAKPEPNTVELITKHGYPVEAHTVQTEDGYILTIFRIPHGKRPLQKSNNSKQVVLLQHGTFSSSEAFVTLGPNVSLSFQLADLGYDVWLGNMRGTKYGTNHVFLNATDPQFWDFSCDEPILYDLPAMVDYILNITKSKKLSYVGHSLGASLALGLSSKKLEYNKKMSVIIGVAPAFSGVNSLGMNTRSLEAKLSMHLVAPLLLKTGHGPMVNNEVIDAIHAYCDPELWFSLICELIYEVGGPTSYLNKANLPAITASVSSSSRKLTTHLGHIFSTGRFHMYAKPGQDITDYPLQLVTVPTAFFFSDGDYIIHPDGIEEMSNFFPNVISINKVPYDSFNHLDFLFAEAATELVYKEIFKVLEQFAMLTTEDELRH